ncbi:helix-turn-helix domain-containing protein [Streptomyces sp. NPDC002076]
MAGTSRETCTQVLREFADRGLLRLARSRITTDLDPACLLDEAGHPDMAEQCAWRAIGKA